MTNAGLTQLGSLCPIYDAGLDGCHMHDGLMKYATIFRNFSTYFILVDIFI